MKKDISGQIVEASKGLTPAQRRAFEDELLNFVHAQAAEVARVVEPGVERILKKHDVQLLRTVEEEVMIGLIDWVRALVKGVQ